MSKIPPLGVAPKSIAQEKFKQQRISDLVHCLKRFADAGEPAKPEWVDELAELLEIQVTL